MKFNRLVVWLHGGSLIRNFGYLSVVNGRAWTAKFVEQFNVIETPGPTRQTMKQNFILSAVSNEVISFIVLFSLTVAIINNGVLLRNDVELSSTPNSLANRSLFFESPGIAHGDLVLSIQGVTRAVKPA